VTVVLKDANGNAVTNLTDSDFSIDFGSSTTAAEGTVSETATDGTYEFTVTNTKAETVTVTVTADGVQISDTAEIVFEAGPVDAGESTVDATSPVKADGVDFSTVTVSLQDGSGNPVAGLTSSDFAINLSGSAIASAVSETGSGGTYSFTLTNTTVETVMVAVTAGGVALTDTATVEFIVPGPSDEMVQNAFESLSYNFMAKRLEMISQHGPRQASLVNRGESGFGTGSNGFNVVGENGDISGDFAFNSNAVIAALNSGRVAVPTADVVDTAPVSAFNLWAEGRFGIYSDDREDEDSDGDFFLGYVGADYRVMDRLILGVMGQIDWMEEEGDEYNSNVEGTGWMVGPYLSAEIAEGVFFDARAMGGRSDNSIDQEILDLDYSGDFQTERWLAEAALTGNFDFAPFTLTPDVRFLYLREDQDDYSVQNGGTSVNVDGETVTLAQLSSGLRVTHAAQFESFDVRSYVGGRLFWNIDDPGELTIDGNYVSDEEFSAELSSGLEMKSDAFMFGVEGTYNGLFDAEDYAVSGSVRFGYQF
jgi:hypothetical protein